MMLKLKGETVKDLELDKLKLREAFDLVVAVYDDPKRKSQLDAWRKQSSLHERAAEQAELDWTVLGLVDDVPLSRFDTVKLAIQVRLERFAEKQLQLAPTLGVAMALFVVVYLGFNTSFRPELNSDAVPALVEAKPMLSPRTYNTDWGQQRTVSLDDGSEIWLDWSTELTVLMTPSERQIKLLRGKALFSVASDPERPFSVTSESAVATVLGTQFVVNRLNYKAVEVEVLEGVVGVQAEGGQVATHLKVADVVRITNGKLGQVKARPLDEIGAWREGILVFEQRPLVEVLEALQPYTSYEIDASYVYNSNRPVSGTFVLSKGDDALQAIMQSYQLTSKIQGRNTLILRSLVPERP